jgi:YidC/Oxa1 family membrane protein insertase
MKLQVIPALLLILSGADGFAPFGGRFGTHVVATSRTARSFGLDPSSFQDLSQHVDSFRDVFTSLTLSDVDLDPSAITDAAPAAIDAATRAAIDAAPAATDAAAAVSSNGGWFGFLTGPIQGLLVLIHSSMVAMGVSSNAWGISIILLTIIVKAVTFPLTKTQLESTNKMQVCFQCTLI